MAILSISDLKALVLNTIYNNITNDIQGDDVQVALINAIDTLDSLEGFVNVHKANGQTTITAYGSKDAARAAVPTDAHFEGVVIAYKLSTGWIIEQNLDATAETWTNNTSWQIVGSEESMSLFTLGKVSSSLLYRKFLDSSKLLTQIDGYITSIGNIGTWSVGKYVHIFDIESLQNKYINIVKISKVNSSNRCFAFYSSKTTFNSTTLIQTDSIHQDSGGSIVLKVPSNALSFAYYGSNQQQYSEEYFRKFVTLIPDVNDSNTYDLFDIYGIGSLRQIVESLANNKVICWGDSLTQGAGGNGTTYPNVLQSLLGDDFTVINAGVGGETSYTIAGRQGGRVFVLRSDVVLPANTDAVEVQLTNYYGDTVEPLRQGGSLHINPCVIDGVKCNMTITQTSASSSDYKCYIARVEAATSTRTIKAGTPILTNYMKQYQNPRIIIVWMGTNGTYSQSGEGDTYTNTLVEQIKKMIEYVNTDRYIVIGQHHVTATGYHTLPNMIELETLCGKEFGAKFVDWRKYVISNGLSDAGITPTSADIQAISEGKCPPSLMSDIVHLNAVGYTLVANLVYKRIMDLGYLS